MYTETPCPSIQEWPKSGPADLPREFELPGNEAILRKEGDRLIIEPATLLACPALRLALSVEIEFPEVEDLPPEPVDL